LPLTAGTRLGPYEILSPLGAGGMGEVYRARDTKLDRDVAVKVLPPHFADDATSLDRFEREAKAIAALSHPNILAIFDFGREGGQTYAVTELLQGETLRARLAEGPLTVRKTIDYGVQIAQGLAAAHDEGIVHRDLKPENVFLTADGRVKILDFGLARQIAEALTSNDTRSPTLARATEPGTVMGTVGYMSPEQVRGHTADARSDIFSFGAVLYEMATGRRAFQRDTAAETMTAILKEDPPEISGTGLQIPPGLDRVVRHCLEKGPKERFQSARDVAFDLQSLSSVQPVAAVGSARRAGRGLLAAVGLAALVGVAAYWAGHRSAPEGTPTFTQVTFRRGTVRGARFAPDGQTVVYGASWEGKPMAVSSARIGSPESGTLELPNADLLAISSTGQLALQQDRVAAEPYVSTGTLAEAPLSGGEAPRERLKGVQWADYSPDGKRIAIVHDAGGRNRLESPVGTVLYESSGWIGHPRFSPTGDAIALIDHWSRIGDMGSVMLLDLAGGKPRTLSKDWVSIQGLAWSSNGQEVWFTGTRSGGNRALQAVSRSGRERAVARQAGSVNLLDISPKGDVLLDEEDSRLGIVSGHPTIGERDLSWLDFSALRDLSSDGRTLLFDESGEGGGDEGSVFLRPVDAALPTRLTTGVGLGFSSDGHWAIAASAKNPDILRLLPVGPGEPRVIAQGKFSVNWACWFPDGKRVLVSGFEPGRPPRLFVVTVDGGAVRPVGPEGVLLVSYSSLISPDGRRVPIVQGDKTVALLPLDGGDPTPIPGLAPGELPCGWDTDGKSLFVYRPGQLPAKVELLDLATGARRAWKELMPRDPAGVNFIRPPHITRDGTAYAYSYARTLSRLFVARGLK
jgi:dipeptidyl aminopeptidase/acylaminoacyl peptidase